MTTETVSPDCAARDRQHLPHQLAGPGGNKPGATCGGVPHDCGHFTVSPGCGGCDPAAVEFTLDDGESVWRRAPEPVYARLIPTSDEVAVRRTMVLDLLQDHRRVQNVRSCSGHGCAWRPEPVGRTGDPEAMRRRHAQFNAHLADLTVAALTGASTVVDSAHAHGPATLTRTPAPEGRPQAGERPAAH